MSEPTKVSGSGTYEPSSLASRRFRFPLGLPLRMTEPGAHTLEAFERACARRTFNYPDVGAMVHGAPEGWPDVRVANVLGHGEAVFERVVRAIDSWQVFDQPWLRLASVPEPPGPGAPVTFASQQYGVWMLHPCRIVDVLDHRGERRTEHTILYGTLEGHVLAGEEAFTVSLDADTGEVVAEIRSFARPGHPIVHVLPMVVEGSRKRFRKGAMARLALAAQGEPPAP